MRHFSGHLPHRKGGWTRLYNWLWSWPGTLTSVLVILTLMFSFYMLPYIRHQVILRALDRSTVCVERERWFMNSTKSENYLCHSIRQQIEDRLSLLEDVNKIFERNGITHFVCYGTLFGVLRNESLLRYDKDVDLCTVDATHEQITTVLDGLPNSYYTPTWSNYHVWRDMGELDITMFEHSEITTELETDTLVKRAGARMYSMPGCTVENFPARYVQTPLPRGKLNKLSVPVPHDRHEILMHFYPDTWHKIVKPVHCKT